MAGNRSRTMAEVRRRGSSRSHKSPLSVALARRNARFYARLEVNGRKSYDDDVSNASSGERESGRRKGKMTQRRPARWLNGQRS